MIDINYYQMEKESEQFASEQREYIEIVSDRYEQEMIKAVNNIKYELNKSESPYLGTDLTPIIDESLAIVDVSEEE